MSGEQLLEIQKPKAAAPGAALAVDGGTPVRKVPLPARMAIGPDETRMIEECLAYYKERQADPGYQGPFEERYIQTFVHYMMGGYADAVATGTVALYVAIAAMELPKGSEVLVSPITDPGTLSAIILQGLKPRLVDSKPGSFNIGPEEFKARIGPNVKGAVIVHSIGQACQIDEIVKIAHENGIKVLEDCSQSHGARLAGRLVGSFGNIAAFSTMYRKAHITGASGGVVFTRDQEMYRKALAHADRGKPRWIEGFDDRNPNHFLFPALNLHSDEISCAVGIASLSRLDNTIRSRMAFVAALTSKLYEQAKIVEPYGYTPGDSPFIYPIVVDPARISCTKTEFARAVLAEGIGLNPHYQYLVVDWPWVKPYLADAFETTCAREIRDRSFALYLNENYGDQEVDDVTAAILKVEKHFAR